MIGPFRLLGIAGLCSALLAVWAEPAPQAISLRDAPDWVGARIEVRGETAAEAALLWRIESGGFGLHVRSDGPLPERAIVTGRLVEHDGRLVLVADQVRPWIY